jgi:hypothetical protein
MHNKRVYLAKSNLASGFDVEYVKSNLLRIPDIEVIDYGTGIRPSECACLVVVSSSTFNPEETETIKIGKEISKAVQDFIDGSENPDSALENVFVYCGIQEASRGEADPDYPIGVVSLETEIVDEDDWKNYADLQIDEYSQDPLLDLVSQSIGSYSSWRKNSRHYKPKEEYAMPPIPSLDQRRAAKAKRSHASESSDHQVETSRPKVTGVRILGGRR